MKNTIFVGIDPGISGAIGLISPSGEASVKDMPIIVMEKKTKTKKGNVAYKREIDKAGLVAILKTLVGYNVHIFLEKVGVMPGEGSVGAFSFGKGLGIIEGIIAALELPVTMVPPPTWKKVMMAGVAGRDKNASRFRCQEIFPKVDVKLVKHDGRAESLLLAEYGRRLSHSSL